MEPKHLSKTFHVRALVENDADMIYDLSCENRIFYEHHPPFVTRESILQDMESLPPGKGYDDKYYIGFFQEDHLVAIMDLILDYPKEDVALIGLFMMDVQYQHKGIGSQIIGEVAQCMRQMGYGKIRIGVDKGNPQSFAFWLKNGFIQVDETQYIIMEKKL